MSLRLIKSLFINTTVLGVSVLCCVLSLELGIRFMVEPVDYLMPTIMDDPRLGHRVGENSGGHDEWGFRNYSRPETVDIVAIGDSMTYGIAAKSVESWPAKLEELSGQSTYNMGLGGYGPLHYLFLMREQAFALDPRTIIVGVYPGNDFLDTISLAYSNDYWKDYRSDAPAANDEVRGFVVEQPELPENRPFGNIRHILARTSVLYRIVTSLPLLDRMRGVNLETSDPRLYVYRSGDRATILTPTQNRRLMNLEDPHIHEAMWIAARAIDEMNQLATERGVNFAILLVPTKEFIYWDRLREDGAIGEHPDLEAALEFERQIREQLISLFDQRGIIYFDPLDELRLALGEAEIYPVNDGHPNAAGYEIIARHVADTIDRFDD